MFSLESLLVSSEPSKIILQTGSVSPLSKKEFGVSPVLFFRRRHKARVKRRAAKTSQSGEGKFLSVDPASPAVIPDPEARAGLRSHQP